MGVAQFDPLGQSSNLHFFMISSISYKQLDNMDTLSNASL